ncbi:MAG: lamin tail domain-containing protein, partial [Melioribacteraceae bacterium]|nr:lamin tail domain-containing protein [Melioribacteraceae bacterium]MCF8264689.1 lamin tail domain-containing protein [Melioribacteraceae bacterium]MCF8413466.1 lamin tail domain-containing protein [Melioribacteraceae bacterium]
MRKYLLSMVFLFISGITLTAQVVQDAPPTVPKLFFSEYIEGSSNNKAIEIYNAEGAEVDLTQFIVLQSSNGDGWEFVHNFPSGATLADGDVWVML